MIKLSELEEKAGTGDLLSQYTLGRYFCGIESDYPYPRRGIFFSAVDAKKGIYWLEKSALDGWVESQQLLGFIYLNGPTVFDVLNGNIFNYIKSLSNGSPNVVFKNNQKGINWFKRAGTYGDFRSDYELGKSYVRGICYAIKLFCNKDTLQGEKLLAKAATGSKDSYMQYELGLRYSHSRNTLYGQPFPKEDCLELNYSKAEEWFVKSTESDENISNCPMYKLDVARRYFYGNGIPQDYKKCRTLLIRCLEIKNNYIEALFLSGLIYSEALGTEQNNNLADEMFSKIQESLTDGNKPYLQCDYYDICYELFFKYADGKGVQYSSSKAVFWGKEYLKYYENSSNVGNYRKNQLKEIGQRFKAGDGVPLDKEFAQNIY